MRKSCKIALASVYGHPRHEDWADRYNKIPELVTSARQKVTHQDNDFAELVDGMDGDGFFTISLSAPETVEPSSYTAEYAFVTTKSLDELRKDTVPPIEWIIPGMIPAGSTISIAGDSNVGKTRWLASLIVSLSQGDTARMGLPQCDRKVSALWFANEERIDDLWRRAKAALLHYGSKAAGKLHFRGKDKGTLRLVRMGQDGPEIDRNAIDAVVNTIRSCNCELAVFDPYITLSEGIDENASQTAALLTEAFSIIQAQTGAAILHAHHTPKDRNKDGDWYRGDSGAWRGSGAIYSALDCGYTLSNWFPSGGSRKAWKQSYLRSKLSRWVVLDTGKIREGEPLDPVIYELIGQEMHEGEGRPIGVCQLSTEAAAENSLLDIYGDALASQELAEALVGTIGEGHHTNMTKIATVMAGHQSMPDITQSSGKKRLQALLGDGVKVQREDQSFSVVLMENPKARTTGKWTLQINLQSLTE